MSPVTLLIVTLALFTTAYCQGDVGANINTRPIDEDPCMLRRDGARIESEDTIICPRGTHCSDGPHQLEGALHAFYCEVMTADRAMELRKHRKYQERIQKEILDDPEWLERKVERLRNKVRRVMGKHTTTERPAQP